MSHNVRVAIGNLGRMLRTQPSIVLLFVLGYTITILAVLIILGAAWGQEVILREQHGGNPRDLYEVRFHRGDGDTAGVDWPALAALIEEDSPVAHAHAWVLQRGNGNESIRLSGLTYRRDPGWPPLESGRRFTEEELQDAARVAIVGSHVPTVVEGGEEYVEAFGERWRVIGKAVDTSPVTGLSIGLSNSLILPFRAFTGIVGDVYTDAYLRLFMPNLADGALLEMRRAVQGVVDGLDVEISPLWSGSPLGIPQLEALLIMLIFAVVITGFAIFNVLALIQYWVRRRAYELGVRFGIGATRQSVRRMLLAEQVLIVMISFLLGVSIFYAIQSLVTRTGFLVADSPLQILLVGLISLGLAFVVTLLSMREISRTDLVSVLRKVGA